MKTIAYALKAGKGLPPEVAAAANKINERAPQLKDWFPVGSGPETKRKTRAKAEIWQKPDEFVLKREALATEAGKLAALANANDAAGFAAQVPELRSEEHTSELQSLMRISYAVFCLKKKKNIQEIHDNNQRIGQKPQQQS